MSFITDPNLDSRMGRRAPQGGAFAALLCLAQLAPDAPAPQEILIQALNAWWDEQQHDLTTLLRGLEERERVVVADSRTGVLITVKPELLLEVERQLAAIPDEQRAAVLEGVRIDVDTALAELVFDVGDPSPAEKEAWHRLFIPHLLGRVADNLTLLPSLASVIAHYEPARFDAVVELIPAYLDAQRTVRTPEPAAEDEEDADNWEFELGRGEIYVEMMLQDACLAVNGVSDARLRRRFHAGASALVRYIERHGLERSLTGRLDYAMLPETPLDERRTCCVRCSSGLAAPRLTGGGLRVRIGLRQGGCGGYGGMPRPTQ